MTPRTQDRRTVGEMVRRSYSISSKMFDEHGYLIGEESVDEIP